MSCFFFFAAAPQAAVTQPWTFAKAAGTTVYFATANPSTVKAYDMQAGKWLPEITLAEVPTAFAADADGLYIAFGRRVSHFTFDGSTETHLKNTTTNIYDLLTNQRRLYIFESSVISAVDKLDGTLIDSKSYFYSIMGSSIAPSLNKIFSRSTGISPSDIFSLTLDASGKLGTLTDSPYHGSYPSASQTYVFPDEARVADNSGIIYNTNNLTYSNSLGGSFTDLAFWQGLPVVLRAGTILALSNTFSETGRLTPAVQPFRIFVLGNTIFAFGATTGGGINAEAIDISKLNPQQPGLPVDPNGLAYTPDAVEMDGNEVVYLLSKKYLSIFRWSAPGHHYLPTIPLLSAPSYMTYAPELNRIFLAYPDGRITQISLTAGLLKEAHFANLPQSPLGIAAAGQFLFAADPSGAWNTHYTYKADGTLIDQKEWNYYSQEYIWSPANQKMYFTRDDTSPNDILWEPIGQDGKLGSYKDSPYHGDYAISHPIRVAPDGSVVLLGTGHIYDALTLAMKDSLSNNVSDAVWRNGLLHTIRPVSPVTQLQQWGTRYGIQKTLNITGSPLRMLSVRQGLLVMTSVKGGTTFTCVNDNIELGVNDAQSNGPILLAEVAPGEKVTVPITVANTGTLPWFGGNQADAYRLVVDNDPAGVCTSPVKQFALPAGMTVAPGQSYTFLVELQRPLDEVAHSIDLKMAYGATETFGSAITITLGPPITAVRSDWTQYR